MHYWQKELNYPEPSLFRALRRSFLREFLAAGIYKLVWGAFVIFVAYYFVSSIVSYVQVLYTQPLSLFVLLTLSSPFS